MSEVRAAVVTGGASGIGRATVERFLAEGWAVVAADLNAENGERLLADLEGDGPKERIRFVRADVSVEDDVAAAVAEAAARYGRLDCMVNNAGVGGAFGPITEVEVDDWDYTFAVLTRSVFLGIKHAARLMQTQGARAASSTPPPSPASAAAAARRPTRRPRRRCSTSPGRRPSSSPPTGSASTP